MSPSILDCRPALLALAAWLAAASGLAGDLDELSDALLADERSRQLQASDDAHAG